MNQNQLKGVTIGERIQVGNMMLTAGKEYLEMRDSTALMQDKPSLRQGKVIKFEYRIDTLCLLIYVFVHILYDAYI
jgi:hypothetical protein